MILKDYADHLIARSTDRTIHATVTLGKLRPILEEERDDDVMIWNVLVSLLPCTGTDKEEST